MVTISKKLCTTLMPSDMLQCEVERVSESENRIEVDAEVGECLETDSHLLYESQILKDIVANRFVWKCAFSTSPHHLWLRQS